MSPTETRHLRSLFSENLKQAQLDEDVQNEDLARDIEVSLRLVQKYRSGETLPRDENLAKLARRLNRTVGWFFTDHTAVAALDDLSPEAA